MRTRLHVCMILFLLLAAAGCGPLPTARPGPALTPAPYSTDTPIPYPWPPTRTPGQPPPPTPTEVQPTPIVLGAEVAPLAEQQVYVSTTLVVAPVGKGPGEIGFLQMHPGELPLIAEYFTVDVHGNIYILDQVNARVVRFDPEGHFVANIPYGDAVQAPQGLAVDPEGQVYIHEAAAYRPSPPEATPTVKVFDPAGNLLRQYPAPSWFVPNRLIDAIYVDDEGMLWAEGRGSYANAPIVEGRPYLPVVAPLGNASEAFDEERQKAMAIPGHLLDSGGTFIIHSLSGRGPAFLYDVQGRRTYELIGEIGPVAIDAQGYWYFLEDDVIGTTVIFRLHKYNKEGKRIASFDLPIGPILVDETGAAYCMVWDRQTNTGYRLIRWQQK